MYRWSIYVLLALCVLQTHADPPCDIDLVMDIYPDAVLVDETADVTVEIEHSSGTFVQSFFCSPSLDNAACNQINVSHTQCTGTHTLASTSNQLIVCNATLNRGCQGSAQGTLYYSCPPYDWEIYCQYDSTITNQTECVLSDCQLCRDASGILLHNGCWEICGDGIVDDDEECDDGNTNDDDGCSAICEIERGWTCTELCTGQGTLSGLEEVPPNGSNGTGTWSVSLDTLTRLLTHNISFSNLGSNWTFGHFHGPAPAGANAGVQIPLEIVALSLTSGFSINTSALDQIQVANLTDGLWYINIHSVGEPGGELRGQINTNCTPSMCEGICGDRLVSGEEECDDGNTENADGCSSECLAEPCTYSQGFWKNIAKPPLNTDPADINATHCREGCEKLGTQCDNLNSTGPPGACGELQDSCDKVCNDTGLYHNLSYPQQKEDLCDHLAGQWFAAIMNFFLGGIQHGFDPTGSPIPDELVEALRDFNITLLCVDQCEETPSNNESLFNMTELLDDYNVGIIGPGHCDDPPDQCCMSCFNGTQCGDLTLKLTIDDGVCANFSCGSAASVIYNNTALPHVFELWSEPDCQGDVLRYSKHLCHTDALVKRQENGISWSGDPGDCPEPPPMSTMQSSSAPSTIRSPIVTRPSETLPATSRITRTQPECFEDWCTMVDSGQCGTGICDDFNDCTDDHCGTTPYNVCGCVFIWNFTRSGCQKNCSIVNNCNPQARKRTIGMCEGECDDCVDHTDNICAGEEQTCECFHPTMLPPCPEDCPWNENMTVICQFFDDKMNETICEECDCRVCIRAGGIPNGPLCETPTAPSPSLSSMPSTEPSPSRSSMPTTETSRSMSTPPSTTEPPAECCFECFCVDDACQFAPDFRRTLLEGVCTNVTCGSTRSILFNSTTNIFESYLATGCTGGSITPGKNACFKWNIDPIGPWWRGLNGSCPTSPSRTCPTLPSSEPSPSMSSMPSTEESRSMSTPPSTTEPPAECCFECFCGDDECLLAPEFRETLLDGVCTNVTCGSTRSILFNGTMNAFLSYLMIDCGGNPTVVDKISEGGTCVNWLLDPNGPFWRGLTTICPTSPTRECPTISSMSSTEPSPSMSSMPTTETSRSASTPPSTTAPEPCCVECYCELNDCGNHTNGFRNIQLSPDECTPFHCLDNTLAVRFNSSENQVRIYRDLGCTNESAIQGQGLVKDGFCRYNPIFSGGSGRAIRAFFGECPMVNESLCCPGAQVACCINETCVDCECEECEREGGRPSGDNCSVVTCETPTPSMSSFSTAPTPPSTTAPEVFECCAECYCSTEDCRNGTIAPFEQLQIPTNGTCVNFTCGNFRSFEIFVAGPIIDWFGFTGLDCTGQNVSGSGLGDKIDSDNECVDIGNLTIPVSGGEFFLRDGICPTRELEPCPTPTLPSPSLTSFSTQPSPVTSFSTVPTPTTAPPRCGDGIVNQIEEECDLGPENDDNGCCTTNCVCPDIYQDFLNGNLTLPYIPEWGKVNETTNETIPVAIAAIEVGDLVRLTFIVNTTRNCTHKMGGTFGFKLAEYWNETCNLQIFQPGDLGFFSVSNPLNFSIECRFQFGGGLAFAGGNYHVGLNVTDPRDMCQIFVPWDPLVEGPCLNNVTNIGEDCDDGGVCFQYAGDELPARPTTNCTCDEDCGEEERCQISNAVTNQSVCYTGFMKTNRPCVQTDNTNGTGCLFNQFCIKNGTELCDRCCRFKDDVCGNEVVEQPETCDPPGANTTNPPQLCRDDCTFCGDSFVQSSETCDPPNSTQANGNKCTANCSFCGDGNVDPGEECDDGNNFEFDACRNNCTNFTCPPFEDNIPGACCEEGRDCFECQCDWCDGIWYGPNSTCEDFNATCGQCETGLRCSELDGECMSQTACEEAGGRVALGVPTTGPDAACDPFSDECLCCVEIPAACEERECENNGGVCTIRANCGSINSTWNPDLCNPNRTNDLACGCCIPISTLPVPTPPVPPVPTVKPVSTQVPVPSPPVPSPISSLTAPRCPTDDTQCKINFGPQARCVDPKDFIQCPGGTTPGPFCLPPDPNCECCPEPLLDNITTIREPQSSLDPTPPVSTAKSVPPPPAPVSTPPPVSTPMEELFCVQCSQDGDCNTSISSATITNGSCHEFTCQTGRSVAFISSFLGIHADTNCSSFFDSLANPNFCQPLGASFWIWSNGACPVPSPVANGIQAASPAQPQFIIPAEGNFLPNENGFNDGEVAGITIGVILAVLCLLACIAGISYYALSLFSDQTISTQKNTNVYERVAGNTFEDDGLDIDSDQDLHLT